MEEKIKQYLKIINNDYEKIDIDVIEFCINEIIDRIKLYLNRDDIPQNLDKIIARIVNTSIKKCINESILGNEVDNAISSISDNGQSISYNNEITKYFTNSSDEELFTGFTSLISRYRRVKVVYSENDDK